LAEELAACREAGVEAVHVDVMDGHFVPNLTLGPCIVEAMKRYADGLRLDVHLMMTHPLPYLQAFRDAGSDAIYVHAEAIGPRTALDALAQVRATGAEVGLAFNPDVDPAMWHEAIAASDAVMIMTVYPGFGGQAFIEATLPRIRALRAAFPDLPIQVDGGVSRATMQTVVDAGATRLVAGSAFFGDADRPGFIAAAAACGG
jgi:ribulose-phosphate 3-epimerase